MWRSKHPRPSARRSPPEDRTSPFEHHPSHPRLESVASRSAGLQRRDCCSRSPPPSSVKISHRLPPQSLLAEFPSRVFSPSLEWQPGGVWPERWGAKEDLVAGRPVPFGWVRRLVSPV